MVSASFSHAFGLGSIPGLDIADVDTVRSGTLWIVFCKGRKTGAPLEKKLLIYTDVKPTPYVT